MAGARVQALGGDDPATLGPYRLIGRLASGGMGRIYLARARPGGRGLVAVKTLLAEGTVGDVDRRRFAREVALAQRVDSAFTARVRDADPDAERPWMAIDYIAAPPLSELVRSCGVLPASAVRWIAAGTAQALVTLHGEGIVHRDVKPQNVLLPLDGPRVIDFGISHASDLTLTGLTLGTIAFTSPEQARGEASTAASDVYSLGATLFLLATGRPPYRADGDTLRLLARVQRGELDLTGLPKELVATIRPCLALDPKGRPTPADLLTRFRRDQAHLPASHSGTRWLPPRWTELIGTYAAQGLELAGGPAAGGGAPTAATVPGPTRVGTAPPPPTLVYPPERLARAARDRARKERTRTDRARREMAALAELAEQRRAEQAEQERAEAERAEAARQEAERLAAQRAEADRARRERERAAQEHERAERERAQRRAERERLERERAERAREARERAAREEAERQRAARERAEQEARRRAARAQARAASSPSSPSSPSRSSSGGTPSSSGSGRPAAPGTPSSGSSGGSTALGWLVAVGLVVALLVWHPWETTSGSGGGSSSGGSSAGSVASGGLGTHTDDSNTDTDSAGSTTGSTDSSSDDSSEDEETEEPTPTPKPTPTPTPTPTPDATDRAFAAVRAGDCLNVYNDGHDNMSADRPIRVGCRASNAYMHVNRVSTRDGASASCDTGAGFTWWSRSGDDGITRTLCLDRVYQVGQCFPAKVRGATNADLTVVWNCNASTVPEAGQSILRITGFYRAPKAGENWTCPAGRGERFWYWPVNQGRSIICASAA
ncbi:serine/threonine-protein kinase [Streptomyces sp. NPDC059783]|uniref:serine/threonine-protein kinase n=1 Tax=Streptomyces sp. NPDC059783 TaxID=3346944 RepID=UPI003658C297